MILLSPVGIVQILNIITNCQHDLVRYKLLIHQIQNHLIRHLFYDQFCFFKIIRTMKYLSGANTVHFRFVGLNHFHGTGFIPPGMVDQQLCINAKQFI